MASYSQDVLEDVRQGNDIVDVIARYVSLKQRGGSYLGLCPFHRETSPSFHVSADKQLYHCFGCGAGGNVIGFIMKIENLGFVDAVKLLADRIHYRLPEGGGSGDYHKNLQMKEKLVEIHVKAGRFFYEKLNSSEGAEAAAYLDSRGISPGARKKFGLGFSPVKRNELYNFLLQQGFDPEWIAKSGLVLPDKKGGFYDKFSGRLMFPILDPYDKMVGFGGRIIREGQPKYLNSPDTPIFDKSRNLYSINNARRVRGGGVIIVEGYMDVIALYQYGFRNVTAALGTAFNENHARNIKKFFQTAILLFDSDEAGERAALRAIGFLTGIGVEVKVLQLSGAKDPDEFVKKYGPEAFSEALKTALPYTEFRIQISMKKYNLQTPGERAKFVREAAGHIGALQSPAERDVYISELAGKTGISRESVEGEVNLVTDKTYENVPQQKYTNKSNFIPNKIITKGVDEARRSLLYTMWKRPDLGRQIGACLESEEMIEDIYIQLFKILKQKNGKETAPADIINSFENLEEQEVVASIFTIIFEYSDDSEYISALNQRAKLVKTAYIDSKISKEDDLIRLQKLVESKRNLKKSYITNPDG